MAHESGEQLENNKSRAPKEGLLTRDMIEVAVLKRRVDDLKNEIESIKAYLSLSWWDKLTVRWLS